VSARIARLFGVCFAITVFVAVFAPVGARADESSAFEALGGGSVSLTPSTPVTIEAGTGAVPMGLVSIVLNDGTPAVTTTSPPTPATPGTGWAAGETLTLELTSDSAGLDAICDATMTAPTVTAANAQSIGLAGITVAAAKTSSCGTQLNAQVLTLPAAPNDESQTTIALSGVDVTPGASISNGSPIYLAVTASNGMPFGSGVASEVLAVATVDTATVSIPKVIGVPASTLGATIGDIAVTDIVGGAINKSLVFTLTGSDTFVSAGTLTAPTGVVASASVEQPTPALPSSTLTFAVAGKESANGVYTLSGAKVDFGADAGVQNITVSTTASAASGISQIGATTPFAFTATTMRIAGTDRYGTAAALYNETFLDPTHPHAVVIASGTDFPDALSADLLASELNTGILLTDPSTLSASAALELTNDDIDKVYLVGGIAAISSNVESQIGALHELGSQANPLISVVRYDGTDRYGTNHAIDDAVSSILGTATTQTFDTALIATGESFADALAAGPIVYASGMPLVLTDPATLVPSALQSLKDLGVKQVIIIGGTSAISAAVETSLISAGFAVEYRIAGEDRTETASFIAQWAAVGLPKTPAYKALPAIAGWDPTVVFVARGDSFADSLAAGPAAGAFGNSILLTSSPTALGSGIPDYFTTDGDAVNELVSLGGDSALSSDVVSSVLTDLAVQATKTVSSTSTS
jgi:putative cell wall-binding protein